MLLSVPFVTTIVVTRLSPRFTSAGTDKKVKCKVDDLIGRIGLFDGLFASYIESCKFFSKLG